MGATENIDERKAYLRSQKGSLTSYASLLGDSFSHRIDLLSQVIEDVHHESLGRYKERLLSEVISDFLPRQYEVGTGFVVFPSGHVLHNPKGEYAGYYLNRREHQVSKQLDIIVYDATHFPVVFRDRDFVVLRPESVRAIVEVKGTLDDKQIKSAMSLFVDFSRKWRSCRNLYSQWHQPEIKKNPALFLMGFQVGVDKRGRKRMNGKRLRKKIVAHYLDSVSKSELSGFPILGSAFIYNDCEVTSLYWQENDVFDFGYATFRGKFVRYTDDGEPELIGDKTIASLLAQIHVCLETPFNQFFSYQDQENRVDIFPHKYQGFERWMSDEEAGVLE